MNGEQLEQWIGNAAHSSLTHTERHRVAAHVAGCDICAAQVAELQAYKTRMLGFQQAKTPDALPAHFLPRAFASLDRVDAARLAPRRVLQPRLKSRPALMAAGMLLLLVAVFASVRTRSPRVTSIAGLLTTGTGSVRLQTEDADRAAQWLGRQLDAEVPTINLALSGARLAAVEAYPAQGKAVLNYRVADGTPITLRIALNASPQTATLEPVTYMGSRYYTQSGAENLVVWRVEQRAFAAASPLPLSQLLPLVHEMDLHCRKRF